MNNNLPERIRTVRNKKMRNIFNISFVLRILSAGDFQKQGYVRMLSCKAPFNEIQKLIFQNSILIFMNLVI